MANEAREKGREVFEQVMGFAPPEKVDDDLFLEATVDHLFAKVWSRGGLSVRERRLITLTVLTCLGHEPTLELHLGAAMRGDLSDEEIDELMLHLTHYAGWPVGALGFGVVRRLRARRDQAKK